MVLPCVKTCLDPDRPRAARKLRPSSRAGDPAPGEQGYGTWQGRPRPARARTRAAPEPAGERTPPPRQAGPWPRTGCRPDSRAACARYHAPRHHGKDPQGCPPQRQRPPSPPAASGFQPDDAQLPPRPEQARGSARKPHATGLESAKATSCPMPSAAPPVDQRPKVGGFHGRSASDREGSKGASDRFRLSAGGVRPDGGAKDRMPLDRPSPHSPRLTPKPVKLTSPHSPKRADSLRYRIRHKTRYRRFQPNPPLNAAFAGT